MRNLFNYETYEQDIIECHKRLQEIEINHNIEKATYNGTLFDYIIEAFNIDSYRNENGNCYICALCDVMNLTSNKKYMPKSRLTNPIAYNKLSGWYNYQAEQIRKEYNIRTIKDIYHLNKNCMVSICCNGGYHMIAYVNGLFYNNWKNRKGMTYNELLKDLGYTRMPKLNYIVADNMLIAKLEQALKSGLIVERGC